jgi:hypothetical protein
MKRIWSTLRKLFSSTWAPSVVLLVLCVVSYGLLINRLGLYWDDWSKTLVNRIFGLSGYWGYYAEDRPLSGWTHIFFLSIFGDRPLYWQILGLALRWLTAVCIEWSLRQIWPAYRLRALLTASLFVVYPLFTQQAIAVTFHQQWLQYLLLFLSLGAMLAAFRRPRFFWLLTFLSLFTMALELTITEYFVGLELLRPVAFWFLVGEVEKHADKRLLRTLWRALPYLVLFAGYVIWRLFFIKLTGEDPYQATTLFAIFTAPWETIQKFAGIIWRDMIQMIVSHWYSTFRPELFADNQPAFISFSWIAGVMAAVCLSLYLLLSPLRDPEGETSFRPALRQALLFGLLAVGLGALPAWITGRQVIFDVHSDRYAMPAMFGISLFTVAILEWITRQRMQRVVLIGILVCLATASNLRLSNDFRWKWTEQTRFYWQLSWRMPYLQPNTAILMDKEPFPYQGLFSTSSAVNLLYPQQKNPVNLAYWIYALGRRYTPDTLPDPLQMSFFTQFRTLVYQGKSPDAVMVYYDPSQATCLWVVLPEDHGDPALSPLLDVTLPLTDPARISREPASGSKPDPVLFGPEPAHTWCYYYQKASLAKQFGDWQQVVVLGDEAAAKGYVPDHSGSDTPHEWRPFIEGYAHANRWEEAEALTLTAAQKEMRNAPWFCGIWNNLDKDLSSVQGFTETKKAIFSQLGCRP